MILIFSFQLFLCHSPVQHVSHRQSRRPGLYDPTHQHSFKSISYILYLSLPRRRILRACPQTKKKIRTCGSGTTSKQDQQCTFHFSPPLVSCNWLTFLPNRSIALSFILRLCTNRTSRYQSTRTVSTSPLTVFMATEIHSQILILSSRFHQW